MVLSRIGERVAERRELPIENGDDARLARMQHDVAETEIPVDDGGRFIVGNIAAEPGDEAFDIREFARFRQFPLSRPTRDLALEIISGTAVVGKADGGFLGSIARADALKAANPRTFLPHQFANDANVEAHMRGTGPEIWAQLKSLGRTPDAFVAGVGTGGTVMGVGRFLKERRMRKRIEELSGHYVVCGTGPIVEKALDELRKAGIISAIGVGINESDTSLRFIQAGDFDCMLLAGRYTLLEQGALDAFLPECTRRNVSVILGGPYNSGILTGGVKDNTTHDYVQAPKELIDKALALAK